MRKVFRWLFLVFIWSWVRNLIDCYEELEEDWEERK